MSLFKNQTRVAMAYTNKVGDKVYPVVVDIKKGIKSTEDIQFVSSDVNTGILSVAFIQGNDNYNVTGANVVCSVMRPDASTLELPCEVVGENIVEVPLGINGTSQDGVYSFDFKVFKGGNKIVGTPIMNYSVSLSIGNDAVVEEDDRLPVLTVLMTQITTLKNETNSVISTANTAIQNANKATDNTKLAISNAQSATQKAEEVITRVNNAIASGTQDLEVKEARDGEVSLKARLDRDIEKAKQVYVNVEGSHISTDSSSGYAKDVEILGNTIQDASNLADIRSVGDKVEGQELYEIPVLSVGKNLFDGKVEIGTLLDNGELRQDSNARRSCNYISVKPNMSVSCYNPGNSYLVFIEYDNSYNVLGTVAVPPKYSKTFLCKGSYLKFRYEGIDFTTLQLEEGTQATPYEPYVEDKLTILSPVQLEKVGDVADRIICKDGVWGVEKNVGSFMLKNLTMEGFNFSWNNTNTSKVNISGCFTREVFEKFSQNHEYGDTPVLSTLTPLYNSRTLWERDVEGIAFNPDANFSLQISINKSKLKEMTAQGFLDTIEGLVVYHKAKNPQFIPLPHDQQIKLRTFASKTNISFGCEIEGTIKAQVPKSLGATVNTHTEQISNLNKELDRVKKLEESTVSTVTTESDFTTVEATSNGYFEDVKLEGKTLVNLAEQPTNNGAINTQYATISKVTNIKPSTEYTYIIRNNGRETVKLYLNNNGGFDWVEFDVEVNSTVVGKAKTLPTISGDIWLSLNKAETIEQNLQVVLLEGDHTQNPPSFFEGLKSVGDTTDEIVVSSVKGDGNLFNECDFYFEDWQCNKPIPNGDGSFTLTPSSTGGVAYVKSKLFNLKVGETYKLDVEILNSTQSTGNNYYVWRGDTTENPYNVNAPFTVYEGSEKVRLAFYVPNGNLNNSVTYRVNFYKYKNKNIPYTPHQSDKKRLLYYNNETQAWEKPILRQWDSIEKHADGKYYYHQRSGEVVLNGSENWSISGHLNWSSAYCTDYINMQIAGKGNTLICDRLTPHKTYDEMSGYDLIGITVTVEGCFAIKYLPNSDTKPTPSDVKQWLQANNVTVVYQLAEEKIYECTNIDLITYSEETNYIVESGAIAPKSILKVHNNISNVVKILQQKVSLLENKFIEGLKQVLSGDMYSLAELLYPEDFEEAETENEVMLLPLE